MKMPDQEDRKLALQVGAHRPADVADSRIRHVIVAARRTDRWVYGRKNAGETAPMAARRMLQFTGPEPSPVCAFSVTGEGQPLYGMLFFADRPDGEGQIGDQDELLGSPAVQTALDAFLQGWLNTQSSRDEIWDVLDANRQPTGRTHRRGDWLPEGDYHLVVHVWIQNSKGEFLLTRRTPNKGYPNMWECTGGSALSGDDSLSAAMREVREETGLTVSPENGSCILRLKRDDNFCDIWLFRQDFDLDDVVFQPNETCGACFASEAEVRRMQDNGALVPFSYLEDLFALAKAIPRK